MKQNNNFVLTSFKSSHEINPRFGKILIMFSLALLVFASTVSFRLLYLHEHEPRLP